LIWEPPFLVWHVVSHADEQLYEPELVHLTDVETQEVGVDITGQD